ncbi:helix-turn-helix domain-containing protein [Microvirga mediterraneensis]|uniref:AraC family transcriptional regulator n=1 Tax=Microvirga mediterraneensis TaxID=2754695 RepID=A0A838BKB6_9HYPH|nr:AraC family transcriptional regulator [Microvirga mediterraneensis]MBA1155918.1 AraC family transcriptional regulator [Microvirga mediterraneensis]
MSRDVPAVVPGDLPDERRTVHLQASPTSLIIEQTLHTKRLDELEDALNTHISRQRFANATVGEDANGMFAFRGHGSFGIFQVRIGRELDVMLEPEEADDRMAFVMTASGAGEVVLTRGILPYSAGHAVIFSSQQQRIVRFDQETEARVFMLERPKVAECCAKLLGHDIPGFVDFDVSADLDTPSGRSWLRLLDYAETEMSDPYSFVRHSPVAWRQFEQQLLTGFLLSQRHEYSQALLAPQAAAVPFYVRRAEAYIEAHFAEPLSLADIAAQAGVSARSLQNGFRSFRHITPMMFLRSVRLHRAHAALRAADPAAVTVTEVALACGVRHVGEFGIAYRRVYGVTPGQTLNKRRWPL